MDIKQFRENLKVKKQTMTDGLLAIVRTFEEETGCCIDHIALTHTDGIVGKEYYKRTIGIFVAVDVLGDQDA